MIIIGLTGSIAMGKSTVSKQFEQCGAAICDSDLLVHRMLSKNGAAVKKVGDLFPKALEGDVINRKILGVEVFNNSEKLKKLERIIHPLVKQEQKKFIKYARLRNKKIVVLDIPLLFETGGEKRCDYVVVVTASRLLQERRAMRRTNMTAEKLKHILKRQMPDSEKRSLADFIVFTGSGKYNSLRQVKQIMRKIRT